MAPFANLLDLVVVGGGPSGLSYALGAKTAAQERGRPLSLCVLEARSRPGGWVHTHRVGGYALETGPYGYLDKHPELGRLVEAMGLEPFRREPSPAAKRRYVLARGKLRPMPTGPFSFLFSRILSLRGKVRLLREPWAAPHPGGDESVAAFATRRLGPEAAEALVVPMFTGIYAGDPEAASLAACFPRMAELEAEHGSLFKALWRLRRRVRASGQGVGAPRGALTSFSGGLSTLVEHLAEALGPGTLRLDTSAQGLARDGEHWIVQCSGESLRTRQVVLAVPAPAAATLLAPLDERLSALLLSIPYTGVVVIHRAHPTEGTRIPAGFGFLAPRTARRDVLGAVFVSTIFPDHAPPGETLIRHVMGGALRPDLMTLSDEALIARVAQEEAALLGVKSEPRFVDVKRYPGSLPQYALGHLDRVAALERQLHGLGGLFITGNALRGIGLADCLAQNFRRGREALIP